MNQAQRCFYEPDGKSGSNSVVEYNLAKVGVAGSNPVFRSKHCNSDGEKNETNC